MLSLALFYFLAVICPARHALPLYPDTSLEPQEADMHTVESSVYIDTFFVLIQQLVADVEDGENTELTDQREVKNLYPLLLQRDGVRDTWNKAGAKDSVQQDKFVNMVDDLKVVVLKLAAADKLRSQGFLRSEQNLPKTNKRACFWKYCVTN